MKNIKKHRFVHLDPEKQAAALTGTKPTKNQPLGKSVKNTELGFIFNDLRISIVTIVIFIITLFVVHQIDQKYDLLEKIKSLVSNYS